MPTHLNEGFFLKSYRFHKAAARECFKLKRTTTPIGDSAPGKGILDHSPRSDILVFMTGSGY